MVFGVGLGNFAIIEGKMNPVRGLFPRMFADLGLVGFILFSLFIINNIGPLFNVFEKKRSRKLLSLCICMGIIQMAFFFNGALSLIYFWVLLSLA